MLSNLSRKVKKVSQSFGCKGHNAKILISFLEGCTQTLNNKCCLWYVLPARSLWLLDFHRQWSKPPVAETNGNHKCYCLINEELSTFCYLQRFFKCQGSCSWKVLMPFIQYNPIKGLSIQSLQHNTQTKLNVRNILEVSIVYWSLKALAHKRVQNRNPVIYLWIRHWPIRKAFFC